MPELVLGANLIENYRYAALWKMEVQGQTATKLSLDCLLPTDSFFLFLIIFYWLWYYSCPNFSPLACFHPASPTPSGNPHTFGHVMGHLYKFFGYSFPILCFTSPWLFCNYLFILFNPLTSSLISPHPFPIWQPSKCSWYPWFCLCSSCLLTLFFRFSCS